MYRIALGAVFCVAVAALAAGIWRSSYVQALGQLSSRGQADLRLAGDRLTRDLQRFQELVVLLAEHPVLRDVHKGGARETADHLLLDAADKTSAYNLVYVGADGAVLASAHPALEQHVPGRVFFQRAMNGALGAHHGLLHSTGARAYSFAAPSFGADGKVHGALIVTALVDTIEFEWRGGRPAVFFTDAAGDVFVSNRTEMLLWSVSGGTAGTPLEFRDTSGARQDKRAHWFGPHEIWRIDWGPYLPQRALHVTLALPVIGLTGEALIDVAPALRLASLQAAVAAALSLAALAMLFLFSERRRVLAEQNAQLEARVAARTEELRRAQADLVQASKLSALGQMSAGISHELNQPLMAIRSFAENGTLFLERDQPEQAAGNLARISDLARRMGRIIKNLRAFARNESEAMTTVDLVAIIEGALDLSAARLRQDAVALHWDAPGHPVWVRGGEVRLGQVLLNLITNACDAMQDQTERALHVNVTPGADQVRLQIMDTGPGIDAPDKIFDPFYSTKEVGASEGMGLGLSISYGLVQSFGGAIQGANRADPETGAIFTIELEAARPLGAQRAA